MVFNSPAFLILFGLFFPLYWASRGKTRLWLCLIASYVFYGWWDYRFLSLLLLSTWIDYGVGLALASSTGLWRRRLWLWVSLACNLGLLCTFKYFNFFAESARRAAETLGVTLDVPTLQCVLPVGISFYTFQTLSYSIDVYRKTIPAEPSLLRFSMFVSFFPQLVAGPIVRASEFLPQLQFDRRFQWELVESGLGLVLLGFFKKVAVADTAAVVVDPYFLEYEHYNLVNAGAILFLYALQIYCDFSGYSDIAIGLARMVGYQLPVNFRFPYWASSPIDFWRRWHISLSTWLRDYLYIPLGGNRFGKLRQYRNLMITMLLGGLWHGANWTFVIWGAIHGGLLVLQHAWRDMVCEDRSSSSQASVSVGPWRRLADLVRHAFQVGIVFAAVCVAWVLFRSQTLDQATGILSSLLDWSGGMPIIHNRFPLIKAMIAATILVLGELVCQIIPWSTVRDRYPVLSVLAHAALIWLLALLGTFEGRAFIYFQF